MVTPSVTSPLCISSGKSSVLPAFAAASTIKGISQLEFSSATSRPFSLAAAAQKVHLCPGD
jgi:hypothetical protein